MQSTASSSSAASHHRQNVTRNINTYDHNDYEACNEGINLMTTHLTSQQQQQRQKHRKYELHNSNSSSSNSNSESDTSTNVHLRNKSKRNSYSRRCIVNRRRRKVQYSGTCLVFLVLTCLVVKLELVFGALNHNSVNYLHNNYTTTLLNESDNLSFLNDVDAIFGDNYNGINETSSRPQVIYQNEFAVHIFGGNEVANAVAAKHGFTNMGQVSNLIVFFSPACSLVNFFLLYDVGAKK